MSKRILFSVLFYLLLSGMLVGNVFAFRSETHVWVAQQVINDLEDGVLTFNLEGQPSVDIVVPSALRDAILSNKAVFRMGNIGPDAFPDMSTGRFFIHFHSNGGPASRWNTDDWLRFLLDSRDIYLMDPSEISECHDLEACSGPIDKGPMSGEQRAFVYGFLSHVATDIFSDTYVKQYSGDCIDFFDGLAEEERCIELEKYIAKATPPLADTSGNYLGEPYEVIQPPVDFIINRLIFNDEVAGGYRAGDIGLRYFILVHELRKSLLHEFETMLDALLNWGADAATCTDTLQGPGMCADFVEIWAEELTAIKALRDNWVRNIESAMKQWVLANTQAIKNNMVGDKIRDPLREWMQLYAGSITGGSYISSSSSTVHRDIIAALGRLEGLLLEMSLSNQTINAVHAYVNEQLPLIYEEFIWEIGATEVELGLFDMFREPISEERLNQVFETPRLPRHYGEAEYSCEGQRLLCADEMAARINTDMQATNGLFDPMTFNAAYNAVVMAKLALLDRNALNELAGKPLYTKEEETNVLLGAVRTLGGSFQWMRKAPPYPYRSGYEDEEWSKIDGRIYGYGPEDPGKGGFKFWADCDSRKNIFRKLFHGPLIPSLETPEAFNFTPLLKNSYPYKVTDDNHFPDVYWGTSCRNADVNGDGNVDVDDLDIVRSFLNQPVNVCPACDLNGDGSVDIVDARTLLLQCDCSKCAYTCEQ